MQFNDEKAWSLARPTADQLAWQDMEMGMFIHWFPMYEPEFIYRLPEHQAELRDPEFQKKIAASFDLAPDPEQWAQAAEDMGAKYVVFVAKHFFGFCRWQSEQTEFCMKNVKWKDGKGDVVGEFYEACKKRGIRFGVYICGDSVTYGAKNRGITENKEDQENYNRVYRAWLTELLTKYGEMCEVWFDGSLAIDVRDILGKYAPHAMVFQSRNATIRWVGQEEGYANDPAWNSVPRYDALSGVSTQKHGNPDGEVWMPLECDARIRMEWGYHKDESNRLRTLDELLEMYYKSVGRGAVLLLNHAPSTRGVIDEEDMIRGKELGDEIRRRFSHPLAETSGSGEYVEYTFSKPTMVDHIVTMEDIRMGERIRAYRIEGKSADGTWSVLAAGSAVGHKKIDFFEEKELTAFRIHILGAVGTPLIRSIKAFFVGSVPHFYDAPAPDQQLVGEFSWELFEQNAQGEQEANLNYPIAQFIEAAGEYELTLHIEAGGTFETSDAALVIGGVEHREYVTEEGDHTYSLYLGGVSGDIWFRVRAHGGTPRGKVYIKRVR